MTLEECRQEKEQFDNIKGICVSGVGFVCTAGFAFERNDGFELIDGKNYTSVIDRKPAIIPKCLHRLRTVKCSSSERFKQRRIYQQGRETQG